MRDIFRRLEAVEAIIIELQEHEDQEGRLTDYDLTDLRGKLSELHYLLRQ